MYFRSYLKFLLKSTNHHGVHSPFVFNYVTKGLYSGKRFSRNRSLDVLLKSIVYFDAKHIHSEHDSTVKQKIVRKFPQVNFDNQIKDILFLNNLEANGFYELLDREMLHNDSLILVDSIYRDSKTIYSWEKLTKLPEISVSMDMFYCGALFIRREQAKEHFTIRI